MFVWGNVIWGTVPRGNVCSGTIHWGKVCRETVRELQKELYEYGLIFLEK